MLNSKVLCASVYRTSIQDCYLFRQQASQPTQPPNLPPRNSTARRLGSKCTPSSIKPQPFIDETIQLLLKDPFFEAAHSRITIMRHE